MVVWRVIYIYIYINIYVDPDDFICLIFNQQEQTLSLSTLAIWDPDNMGCEDFVLCL